MLAKKAKVEPLLCASDVDRALYFYSSWIPYKCSVVCCTISAGLWEQTDAFYNTTTSLTLANLIFIDFLTSYLQPSNF